MRVAAEIRVGGQNAFVHGMTPFSVKPADPTGEVDGYVMVDRAGLNCVRFREGGSPVIFTDQSIVTWMARDLSSWR